MNRSGLGGWRFKSGPQNPRVFIDAWLWSPVWRWERDRRHRERLAARKLKAEDAAIDRRLEPNYQREQTDRFLEIARIFASKSV